MTDKSKVLVVVNQTDNPDGTLNLMITWTGITAAERDALLADLAETFNWPTDEKDILPYNRA